MLRDSTLCPAANRETATGSPTRPWTGSPSKSTLTVASGGTGTRRRMVEASRPFYAGRTGGRKRFSAAWLGCLGLRFEAWPGAFLQRSALGVGQLRQVADKGHQLPQRLARLALGKGRHARHADARGDDLEEL